MSPRLKLIAALLLCLAPRALAADAGIAGVWKISSPQSELTPAGGGLPPFTARGRQQYEANRAAAAKGDDSFDPVLSKCSSPGQPRLMLTARPFAIYVRPRMVSIIYSWNRLYRQIAVGAPMVSPALGPDWWKFGTLQGHAEARWEGGTLVIHTVALTDQNLLDAYISGSDQLDLVEHLRLRRPNLLEDRITITDPVMFTKPWDAVITYSRQPDSLLPFAEDVCLDRIAAGKPALP